MTRVPRAAVGVGGLGAIAFALYQRYVVRPVDEQSEREPFPAASDDAPRPHDLSVPLATGDIDRAD